MGWRIKGIKIEGSIIYIMENVFRFITDLGNFLNLINRTEVAEEQMKKEPRHLNTARNRYCALFRECSDMYRHINKTMDEELFEFSHSITAEINKRNLNGQNALKN